MKLRYLILGLLPLVMAGGCAPAVPPESATPTPVTPPPSPTPPKAALPPLCRESEPLIALAQTENVDLAFCGAPEGGTTPGVYRSRNRDGSPGVELELPQERQPPGEFVAIAQTKKGSVRYQLLAPRGDTPAQLLITLPDGAVVREAVTRFVSPVDDVRRNYQRFKVCQSDGDFVPDLDNNEHQVYGLGQNRYLVLVVCRLAAYQAVTEWVLYEPSAGEPRVMPVPYEDFADGRVTAAADRVMVGLPSFDPMTQVVTNFQKFRGPGDCGIFTRHRLEGTKLTLQEFRLRECDATTPRTDPTQFPLLFSAPSQPQSR